MLFICDSGYRSVGLHDFFSERRLLLKWRLGCLGNPCRRSGEHVTVMCLLLAGLCARPPPLSPQRGRLRVPTVESKVRASPVGLIGDGCAPQGMPDNVWKQFWLSHLGVVSWHPVGGGLVLCRGLQPRAGLPTEGAPQPQCQRCHGPETPVEPKSCSFSRNFTAAE